MDAHIFCQYIFDEIFYCLQHRQIPNLLGATFFQNWMFLVLQKHGWPSFSMRMHPDLHNSRPHLDGYTILTNKSFRYLWHWKLKKRIKSRLALLSFKKRVLQARTTTTHVSSQFSLFHIYHLLSCCFCFPLSSVLFPHTSPLYFCNTDASSWLEWGFI